MFRRQFLLANTEQTLNMGIADVWVVDKNYMAIEIEIKVSKSDLRTELSCIQRIVQMQKEPLLYSAEKEGGNKYRKHKRYLTNKGITSAILPNRFYFAVPEELKETALEVIKETPYGLLVVEGSMHSVYIIKSGKLLHSGVIGQNTIKDTIRRVCTENYNLRVNLRSSIDINTKLREKLIEQETPKPKYDN